MLETTKDAFAVIGIYATLFGALYFARHLLTQVKEKARSEVGKRTQAVRIAAPEPAQEEHALYGLPDVQKRKQTTPRSAYDAWLLSVECDRNAMDRQCDPFVMNLLRERPLWQVIPGGRSRDDGEEPTPA